MWLERLSRTRFDVERNLDVDDGVRRLIADDIDDVNARDCGCDDDDENGDVEREEVEEEQREQLDQKSFFVRSKRKVDLPALAAAAARATVCCLVAVSVGITFGV